MINVTSKHASVSVSDSEACDVLQRFISRCDRVSDIDAADLHLENDAAGLQLSWHHGGRKSLIFNIDYEKEFLKQRSFPAPKQGAFNQALGKKTRTIIDATGGWGGDAILMCMQGYQVTIVERLPLMAAMIEDALMRLSRSSVFKQNQLVLPKLICDEASEVLANFSGKADCVYLDPMFPSKKKKSAASNKNMQLLQWLAGPDIDADDVAIAAVKNFPRVAVKRPDYAQPLAESTLGKAIDSVLEQVGSL